MRGFAAAFLRAREWFRERRPTAQLMESESICRAGDWDTSGPSRTRRFLDDGVYSGMADLIVVSSVNLQDPGMGGASTTIALALEAVRRRPSAALVRLCASHRVIRLQPFDVPGYSPHFRLFALL